eukprot:TRINITY_DN3602_c0_g1_i1.p1 TRINITY_DN3602_c0_g1~~TRINITY_DN3602_c0_g1_i1.p1  ORF type:complete len:143 (+),score=46.54 TRINITY_DN3602_c0_g1_i1:283-711(+)
MNNQSNSKSLTPQQKIQQIQQQQMFNSFGGMRIGNNNHGNNNHQVPNGKQMNNSNGMYTMNIPIHHSQSLPNHFYDGSGHSPNQYQSWVPQMGMVQNQMPHLSGSPYGHYMVPPPGPNGFAHLSIPPSMLQQNHQSSPNHRK